MANSSTQNTGFVASLIAGTLIVPMAIAQTVEPASTTDKTAATNARSSQGGSGVLEELIVTAQRRAEKLERTPVAVSVVSSDDLSARAIVSESDLQSTVPGLVVRGTQNSNQLNYSLRGQSVDAFSSSRPAVLPYINEVQVSGGGASAFYDLQSVQVLKGPQGTLFGRNATGGAVLFSTTKPTEGFSGYLTGRAGDYDHQSVEGAANLPLGTDKLLLRVAGFYESRDGYQENRYTDQTLGDVDRRAGRVTLVAQPTDALTNTLVFDASHSGGSSLSPVLYSAYAPFSPATLGAPIPAPLLYGPTLDIAFNFPGAWDLYKAAHPKADPAGIYAFADTQRQRGPYDVSLSNPATHDAKSQVLSNITTLDVGEETQIKNVFGYTHSTTQDSVDFDGSPYLVEETGAQGTQTEGRQVSEELQLIGKTLNNNLSYVTGLYYSTEKNHQLYDAKFAGLEPLGAAAEAVYISNATSETYAAYAQGTYDLSTITGVEGLGATLGGRYTSEKITSEQRPGSVYYNLPVPTATNKLESTFKKPSWTVGVQEQLNDDLLLYLVTRRSFRSGGFNTLAPPFPGTADAGGAEFDPEIATDVEIGAKFQGYMGDIPTRLSVAAYSQWVKDIQRTIYANLPSTGLASLSVNIPEARIQGIEFDAQASPAAWLKLGVSGAYTDAKYTDNKATLFGTETAYGPFADTPRLSGSLYMDVATPLPSNFGTLSLRSDVYGQSKFYFGSLNDTTVPGTDVPGYALVNFRIGLANIGGSGVSVAAILHNAFDKVYYVGGIPIGGVMAINSALPGDPRTFMGEIKYEF